MQNQKFTTQILFKGGKQIVGKGGKDEDGHTIKLKGQVLDLLSSGETLKCPKGKDLVPTFESPDQAKKLTCDMCYEEILPSEIAQGFLRSAESNYNVRSSCAEKLKRFKEQGETWFGAYMEGNESHSLTIEKVKVSADNTLVGEGRSQRKQFLVQGSLVKERDNIFKFQFKREFTQVKVGSDVVYFDGHYMKDSGKLEGTWGRKAGETLGSCRFHINTIASINIKTMQGAACRSRDSEYV